MKKSNRLWVPHQKSHLTDYPFFDELPETAFVKSTKEKLKVHPRRNQLP